MNPKEWCSNCRRHVNMADYYCKVKKLIPNCIDRTENDDSINNFNSVFHYYANLIIFFFLGISYGDGFLLNFLLASLSLKSTADPFFYTVMIKYCPIKFNLLVQSNMPTFYFYFSKLKGRKRGFFSLT